MGKYEPLQRYLETLDCDSWEARLTDIEQILGFALPASAYKYYAWWANETSGSHSHAKSWQQAGWHTRDVNLHDNTLRFERIARSGQRMAPARQTAGHSDPALAEFGPLLDLAGSILNVTNHREIMRLALEALVRNSVSKALISLGGTMPDLQMPDRERPAL
jgi:hypothetical protein